MIVPAAVSQIIVLIYNMADTFYIGRTNDPYMLAGASLILPVFNMLLCLSSLAGIGGGTLISRLLGSGEEEEARKVSAFSFWLAVALSLAFSLGLGCFMTPALRFLGAGDNIFLYARQYSFCVIVLGAVPTVLSNVMAHLVRSVGMSREAGFGITLGAVLNIALDPVFMYLILPDGQQVLGVGIATLLSNCVACVYFLVILWQIRQHTVLTADPRGGLPCGRNIAAVFGVGIPSAVASLLFDLDYVVIDKLMVSYSEVALAAIGIVLKVERLPLNVGIGICQGMVPLVAYNCASGNEKRMNQVIRLSLATGLVVAAASILLYELFTPWIVRVFISDAPTVALATTFLRIRILATPLMFLSFFTVYIFQGFGNGRISLFLGVVRWAVFNIPMLYLLNFCIGMYGIVWSQIVADVLTVLLSVYVYRTRRPAFAV
ncbi:multidrug export protein MepA [Subdoligranulum variabile DSM 15176]|uniref:Multidrug export protein MepA n=2 Tax=Subdoligranulum variabile TaxID=214851 RepID=D1PII5_9FIRM|nr:multidrug export protein MepA [Subdoligranulum variabile DSM 15176]